MVFEPEMPHFFFDRAHEPADKYLAFGGRFVQPLADVLVIVRFQVHQGEILQFGFDIVQSQLMRDLGIQVQAFPRFFGPFLRRKNLQTAHHFEPVGQLDQNHAGIGRIRNDQLPEIIDLVVGHFRIDVRDVAQSLQDADALFSEMIPELMNIHQLQAHHIVQQRRDRRIPPESHLLNHDHRGIDRMGNERRPVVTNQPFQPVDRQTQCRTHHPENLVVEYRTRQIQKRLVIFGIQINLFLNLFHIHPC